MPDTSIRISEETKRRLELARRDGESFDDVVGRLASRDHWTGFGVLADEEGATRTGVQQLLERVREWVDDGTGGS